VRLCGMKFVAGGGLGFRDGIFGGRLLSSLVDGGF